MTLYDKTRREIMKGDVVKVFHFIGPRRKRYYMYKQALGVETLGSSQYMKFGHLNMRDEGYHEHMDGRILEAYEIVQSIDARFEDRPRLPAEGETP